MKQFQLGTLDCGGLRVRKPFSVHMEVTQGGVYVAQAIGISEFGYGDNWSKALSDLQFAIVGLYFGLEGRHEQLGSDLAATWDVLQDKIERV